MNALVNKRTLLIAKIDALKVIIDGNETTPLDLLDVRNYLDQVKKLTSSNDKLGDKISEKCKTNAEIIIHHKIYDVEGKRLAAIKKSLQLILASFSNNVTTKTNKYYENSDNECSKNKYRIPRYCAVKHRQPTRHSLPTEKCPECSKAFTRKDNLTRHRKMKHESDTQLKCKFCLKLLSRKDAVERHEGNCHNNPNRHPSSSSGVKSRPPEEIELPTVSKSKSSIDNFN